MTVGVCIGIIILGILIGFMIYEFGKLDNEKKIACVKEWLKLAVVEAEKYLGGGTGQLKLRYVYDLAIKQFPWLVALVTFEVFGEWVDEALEWMKQQIESNNRINEYVNK